MILADVTNVGDPLAIPVHIAHATFWFVCFKKKGVPTWETHDWPVVPYNASYALNGLSIPLHLLGCDFGFLLRVGVFCFRVWWQETRMMSKYISPWHLSLLCSIFALMHSAA